MIRSPAILTPTKTIFWLVMPVAWLGQAMAARNPLDSDWVSYLNIAYSCLRENWHALVNGYRSPGCPFLLAMWMKLFRIAPAQESLAVLLFAACSLTAALFCFEYFLSRFFESRRRPGESLRGRILLAFSMKIPSAGWRTFYFLDFYVSHPHIWNSRIF